jgi:hypothetical protein
MSKVGGEREERVTLGREKKHGKGRACVGTWVVGWVYFILFFKKEQKVTTGC